MRDFKKYAVWQFGRKFCVKVYSVTKNYPKDEIYGKTSQIRKTSLSIPTNISEVAGRYADKDIVNIALGLSS